MNKLSTLEFNTIVYFLIRSSCVGLLISSAITLAENNAYLSIIIGATIGMLIFYFYYLMLKKKIVISKIGRRFLGIAIFIFTCLLFTDLVMFVSSQYLYNTPKWIVSLAFIIPLFYIGFYDKKVIARTGLILFYISIFLFLLAFVFLFFQIDYTEFLPFMKVDYKRFGLSIFNIVLFIITPLILIIDLPVRNIEKLKFKNFLPGYLMGVFSVLIAAILVIGIYGYKFCLLLDYPYFQVLKRISSISFLERAEHFIFMQWIFDIFIYLALSVNFIKNDFKNQKLINFIVCILAFFCPLYIFTNNNFFINVITYIIPIILFSFLILFLIIEIIKKRSKTSL